MHRSHDLSSLDWTLTGWAPHLWRAAVTMEIGAMTTPDHRIESVNVPGSVQFALRDAGVIPDWNQAGNPELCEWVENRHWMYEADIPDAWLGAEGLAGGDPGAGRSFRLSCLGLDYSGWVLIGGTEIGRFVGTNVPQVFDLTEHLGECGNRLRIVFDTPPRWMGQFGYTSQFTEWKTRFNYQWDWQPRLVQLGIWDDITLEVVDGAELAEVRVDGDADPVGGTGILRVSGRIDGGDASVEVALRDGERVVRRESVSATAFAAGIAWDGLGVELWWPNGQGAQPLYDVDIVVTDSSGVEQDRRTFRVGFRNVSWERCEGTPDTSDTWLCVVNGRAVFLQGVNFPPMAGNFADVTEEQYRARLELYREIGLNTFRINACQYLEKEVFYDLCDELGLLVWQDLPITSSLIENIPPSDPASIEALEEIFRSFIARRRHHASLMLWSGGNEQFSGDYDPDGNSVMVPIDDSHPMYARLSAVAKELDPGRRWIPASPTGPRFGYNEADVGKFLHENVHGPYGPAEGGMDKWREYWEKQDAQFRAELGTPGTARIDVIEKYAGGKDPMPVDEYNPVWRRPVSWWVERAVFLAERGHEPESLAEYVEWSQARQAESLAIAMKICKDDFPRNGGVLLWCGHDSYPTPANCSIIDFENNPKPAALALKEIWRRDFVE